MPVKLYQIGARAYCGCGWKPPFRLTRRAALRDLRAHWASAITHHEWEKPFGGPAGSLHPEPKRNSLEAAP